MTPEPRTRPRQATGLALALVLSLGLAACSKRSGSSGGDGASMKPGPTSARVTLQAILDAYRGWDIEGVLSHVDADFYPQYTLFRQSLYEDREKIDQVQLDVIVNQEIASGDSVILRTRWNRVHTPNATGVPVRATGSATWHFHRESGKLIDLRGGRPIAFN